MAQSGEDLRSKVMAEAWLKLKQNYLGATPDNCCNFVRAAFRDAGYILPETSNPSDMAVCLANGYTLGEGYANSLAGNEIGRKVPYEEAQAGDIVLFYNLGASSSFVTGTITHVGIYAGDGYMIDHGESGMHHRAIANWPGLSNVAEVRRPKLFDVPQATRTRIALENGKLTLIDHNKKAYTLSMAVIYKGTTAPVITVNNAPLWRVKQLWLKVKDKSSGKMYRLSSKDGGTFAAGVNGTPVTALSCKIKAQAGGVHIYLNNQEIGSQEAAFEIVHMA